VTTDQDLRSNSSNKKVENRLHRIWVGMNARCEGKKDKRATKDYKERVITVCDEWKKSFTAFSSWALGNYYCDNLSIDRIDNKGNYTPDNCRWTTCTVQARNTRVLYSK